MIMTLWGHGPKSTAFFYWISVGLATEFNFETKTWQWCVKSQILWQLLSNLRRHQASKSGGAKFDRRKLCWWNICIFQSILQALNMDNILWMQDIHPFILTAFLYLLAINDVFRKHSYNGIQSQVTLWKEFILQI